MPNIALVLEYNGAKYNGYQKQLNLPTIQGELELALYKFTGSNIATITAGRTDAMVHALFQVVSFTTELNRPIMSWLSATNGFLPADIRIKDVQFVDDSFNARFSATSRVYNYYLLNDKFPNAILHNLVGFSSNELDIELMQEGCNIILGLHDFSAFRASNCQANNPIRDMRKAIVKKKGNIVRFTFEANAFLYHMIRNIVGALIYLGRGKISLFKFIEIFHSRNRSIAPPTFMPNGLYLTGISYLDVKFNHTVNDWLF